MLFLFVPNEIGLAGLDLDLVGITGFGQNQKIAFVVERHAVADIGDDEVSAIIKMPGEGDFDFRSCERSFRVLLVQYLPFPIKTWPS